MPASDRRAGIHQEGLATVGMLSAQSASTPARPKSYGQCEWKVGLYPRTTIRKSKAGRLGCDLRKSLRSVASRMAGLPARRHRGTLRRQRRQPTFTACEMLHSRNRNAAADPVVRRPGANALWRIV